MFDLAQQEQILIQRNEELERQRKRVVEEAERLVNAQVKLLEENTAEVLFQTVEELEEEVKSVADEDEEVEVKAESDHEEENVDLSNFEKTTLADIQLETKVLGADQLSDASASKFYKARCSKLEEELAILAKKCSMSSSDLIDAKTSLKKKTNDFELLEKRFNSLQNRNKKLKEQVGDFKKSDALLKDEIKTLERQLRIDKQKHKKSRSDSQTHDIRLNRALAEVKKYKDLCTKYKNESKDYLSAGEQKIGKLQGEIQSLKRQKRDIMTAYKKQIKLIDVLKRQKLHLEAAKVLSFTEEDFIRTLEIGQKLHLDG